MMRLVCNFLSKRSFLFAKEVKYERVFAKYRGSLERVEFG